MATIRLDPETLRAKASEVRGYKTQDDEAISKLKTLVGGLNETWQGNAQVEFNNSFESMQSTFTNFSEMLENYAKSMENFANKMESEDRLN